MTDTFIQEGNDNSQQSPINSFQATDTVPAGSEGADTKSPEYQLQMLQKRLTDKDEFINTLKEESQQARQMYSGLEERMNNMESISEVLKGQQKQVVEPQDTSLDENALVGKVIDNLNRKQTEDLHQSNYSAVLSRLDQEFGAQHIEDKVAAAALANGLSMDDMVQTARKSPTAFYKLVGVASGTTPQRSMPSPTHGSQVTPQDTGAKDFAYYSNLMKTNPKEYWKANTQREYRKLFLQPK